MAAALKHIWFESEPSEIGFDQQNQFNKINLRVYSKSLIPLAQGNQTYNIAKPLWYITLTKSDGLTHHCNMGLSRS